MTVWSCVSPYNPQSSQKHPVEINHESRIINRISQPTPLVPQLVLLVPNRLHHEFVGDQKLTGVVRFSGLTKFADGEWLGIEYPGCSGDREVGTWCWGFTGIG